MNASKTILIVDDTNVNVLKADFILKNEGYATLKANSGAACIKILKTHHADLILLDIEMPEMNGFETLDIIRSNPATADIPVIFVTSDNDEEIVLKAIKKKVAAYVTKPFNEDELLGHVSKIFAPKYFDFPTENEDSDEEDDEENTDEDDEDATS